MRYEYFAGYPRRHLRDAIRGVTLSIAAGGILTALAAYALSAATAGLLSPARSVFNVFGFLFAGYFTYCFGYGMLIGGILDSIRARIVPYFESRVGKKHDAFRCGAAIARRCAFLDDLCLERGARPISSFGFGEPVVWHEASEGLETIRGLIAVLNGETLLLNDLRAMEQALLFAADQKIRFCFILRNGMDRYISTMEMDRRAGSFW